MGHGHPGQEHPKQQLTRFDVQVERLFRRVVRARARARARLPARPCLPACMPGRTPAPARVRAGACPPSRQEPDPERQADGR